MDNEWKPKAGDRVFVGGDWPTEHPPENLEGNSTEMVVVEVEDGRLGLVDVRGASLTRESPPVMGWIGKVIVREIDPEDTYRTQGEVYRASATDERAYAAATLALADALERLADLADERDRSSGS